MAKIKKTKIEDLIPDDLNFCGFQGCIFVSSKGKRIPRAQCLTL